LNKMHSPTMADILLVPDTIDPVLTWGTVFPTKADASGNNSSPLDDLSRTGVKSAGVVFVDDNGTVQQEQIYVDNSNFSFTHNYEHHNIYPTFDNISSNAPVYPVVDNHSQYTFNGHVDYDLLDEATLDASTFVAEYFVQPIGGFEPPVNELDMEMVSMGEGDASLTELSVTDILMEIRNEVAELESGATSPDMQSRPATVGSASWDGSGVDWQMSSDDQSTDGDDVSLASFAQTTPRATKRLNRNQPLDRRERKKLQNREAAQRYRVKKQVEKVGQSGTLEQLTKRNATLKASIHTLETEVDIMKRLLRDVQVEAAKKTK